MMSRRTVSFTDGMEDAIREYQAELMVASKKDVTFAEALHYVLWRGFILGGGGTLRTWWKRDSSQSMTGAIMEELDRGSSYLREEAVLDFLPPELAASVKEHQNVPATLAATFDDEGRRI